MDAVSLSAHDCRDLLASSQVSATELTTLYLDHIERVDRDVGSFLLVDREGALARAAAVDATPPAARRTILRIQ